MNKETLAIIISSISFIGLILPFVSTIMCKWGNICVWGGGAFSFFIAIVAGIVGIILGAQCSNKKVKIITIVANSIILLLIILIILLVIRTGPAPRINQSTTCTAMDGKCMETSDGQRTIRYPPGDSECEISNTKCYISVASART